MRIESKSPAGFNCTSPVDLYKVLSDSKLKQSYVVSKNGEGKN